MISRRQVLTGLAGLTAAGGAAGTSDIVLRWSRSPRRYPLLTQEHLAQILAGSGIKAGPRVLFVGNSFTLMHDIPGQVRALADRPLHVATAAANGARLVETWHIPDFQRVLDVGWDALVMQDFSTIALQAPDRWGSAYAMRAMAARARAKAVLLYPTWAFPTMHGVYHRRTPLGLPAPQNPAAFARIIEAHYSDVADAQGWSVAPVTMALAPDATPWLGTDIHHLNARGGARVAQVLWNSLRTLV